MLTYQFTIFIVRLFFVFLEYLPFSLIRPFFTQLVLKMDSLIQLYVQLLASQRQSPARLYQETDVEAAANREHQTGTRPEFRQRAQEYYDAIPAEGVICFILVLVAVVLLIVTAIKAIYN